MLTLQNLQPAKGSTHRRKRLGRGNSSGRGNYSTKGLKGQRARSGGRSGLASRSIKGYLLRIPKNRGFQSFRKGFETINLQALEDNFAAGAKVNVRELLKKGMVKTATQGLKVLAAGKLTKKLVIEANTFSKLAKEKILKSGGQAIELIKTKKAAPKENK